MAATAPLATAVRDRTRRIGRLIHHPFLAMREMGADLRKRRGAFGMGCVDGRDGERVEGGDERDPDLWGLQWLRAGMSGVLARRAPSVGRGG
ncbi:hypothetical protein GCM10027053_03010 [Intrasporangium mesophilum]